MADTLVAQDVLEKAMPITQLVIEQVGDQHPLDGLEGSIRIIVEQNGVKLYNKNFDIPNGKTFSGMLLFGGEIKTKPAAPK